MKIKIAIIGFIIARSLFWIGGFDIFVRSFGNANSFLFSILTGGIFWLVAAINDETI